MKETIPDSSRDWNSVEFIFGWSMPGVCLIHRGRTNPEYDNTNISFPYIVLNRGKHITVRHGEITFFDKLPDNSEIATLEEVNALLKEFKKVDKNGMLEVLLNMLVEVRFEK
jgi:hypothetical protein